MPLPLPAPGDAYPGLPVRVDTPQLEFETRPFQDLFPWFEIFFWLLPGCGQPSESKGEFEASRGTGSTPPLRARRHTRLCRGELRRPGFRRRARRERRVNASPLRSATRFALHGYTCAVRPLRPPPPHMSRGKPLSHCEIWIFRKAMVRWSPNRVGRAGQPGSLPPAHRAQTRINGRILELRSKTRLWTVDATASPACPEWCPRMWVIDQAASAWGKEQPSHCHVRPRSAAELLVFDPVRDR
jgi:hypothetical protein